MEHMGFKIVGPLHIILVGEANPTQGDWDEYIRALHAEAKKTADLTQWRTLVITDGGGPNAAQRKNIADLLNGKPSPLAMLTTNSAMRMIIQALRWFNSGVRAYAPAEVDQALQFLGVPILKWDSIRQTAIDLQATLKIPKVRALEEARLNKFAVAR
jgi:hypothetical protein